MRVHPPRLDSPVGWLTRDHRKSVAVDGRVGFVSGLCPSARWLGDPARRLDVWRDTGLEIGGPAVAEVERAFAQVWRTGGGDPIDEAELTPPDAIPAAGDVSLRVIATVPNSGGLLRLDQLIAAAADGRLWLTDAYFVGLTPYVQALCAAARDDVDVRLLVPGSSDVPVVSGVSRAAIVRCSKAASAYSNGTAACSTRRAPSRTSAGPGSVLPTSTSRAGSPTTSWTWQSRTGDWSPRWRRCTRRTWETRRRSCLVLAIACERRRRPRGPYGRRALSGSAGRAAAGAMSVGAVVGAALTSRRTIGPAEANLLGVLALILIVIAVIALVLWPPVLAFPIALISAWAGVVMLTGTAALARKAQTQPGRFRLTAVGRAGAALLEFAASRP